MPNIIYTRSFCAASNTIFMTCARGGTRCAFRAAVPVVPSALWRRISAAPVFDFTARPVADLREVA